MLINALAQYYDILSKQGKLPKDGYSTVGIAYKICLRQDGSIADIINCEKTVTTVTKGGATKNTLIPAKMVFPFRIQIPGIAANIIDHRSLYIFGLNYDNGVLVPSDRTDKAVKSHKVFVEKNAGFFNDLSSPLIDAFKLFIENWNPENETKNPVLIRLEKEITRDAFAFCLDGEYDNMLQDEPQVIEKWDKLNSNVEIDKEKMRQCAVSGKVAKTANLHNVIKNIAGGQASGCKLVCYNNDSEFSYGKEQAFNSNISVEVMKKYAAALNYLTGDKDELQHYTHKNNIGDMTVVYWSANPVEDNETALFNKLLFGGQDDSTSTDNELSGLLEKAKNGVVNSENFEFSDNINPETDFYIVGLKPNASRLMVKFIYKNKFGKVFKNICQHQLDMQTLNSKPFTFWQIQKELISPKSKNETVSSSINTKLIEAAIFNRPYPSALLAQCVKRVKTDSDTDTTHYIKLNSVRAGIIKACLNRNAKINKNTEVIKLALDTENTNPAYLCGRIFSLLEKIQQCTVDGELNRTIKDTYFSSACSTPASVFPRLFKLAQNHLQKAKNMPKAKIAYWCNGQISDICNKMGQTFPQTLSLNEQGAFILGYYQQCYFRKDKNDQINENKGDNLE